MPVKQNMPIWSVMCDHSRDDPSFARLERSSWRIEMILSAIPLTSANLETGGGVKRLLSKPVPIHFKRILQFTSTKQTKIFVKVIENNVVPDGAQFLVG